MVALCRSCRADGMRSCAGGPVRRACPPPCAHPHRSWDICGCVMRLKCVMRASTLHANHSHAWFGLFVFIVCVFFCEARTRTQAVCSYMYTGALQDNFVIRASKLYATISRAWMSSTRARIGAERAVRRRQGRDGRERPYRLRLGLPTQTTALRAAAAARGRAGQQRHSYGAFEDSP